MPEQLSTIFFRQFRDIERQNEVKRLGAAIDRFEAIRSGPDVILRINEFYQDVLLDGLAEQVFQGESDLSALMFEQNSRCGFVDAQGQAGAGQRRQGKQDGKAKGEEKPFAAHDCLQQSPKMNLSRSLSSTHFNLARHACVPSV